MVFAVDASIDAHGLPAECERRVHKRLVRFRQGSQILHQHAAAGGGPGYGQYRSEWI